MGLKPSQPGSWLDFWRLCFGERFLAFLGDPPKTATREHSSPCVASNREGAISGSYLAGGNNKARRDSSVFI